MRRAFIIASLPWLLICERTNLANSILEQLNGWHVGLVSKGRLCFARTPKTAEAQASPWSHVGPGGLNLAPYTLRRPIRTSNDEISHPMHASAALPRPTVSSQVMVWTPSVSGHSAVIAGFCPFYAIADLLLSIWFIYHAKELSLSPL